MADASAALAEASAGTGGAAPAAPVTAMASDPSADHAPAADSAAPAASTPAGTAIASAAPTPPATAEAGDPPATADASTSPAGSAPANSSFATTADASAGRAASAPADSSSATGTADGSAGRAASAPVDASSVTPAGTSAATDAATLADHPPATAGAAPAAPVTATASAARTAPAIADASAARAAAASDPPAPPADHPPAGDGAASAAPVTAAASDAPAPAAADSAGSAASGSADAGGASTPPTGAEAGASAASTLTAANGASGGVVASAPGDGDPPTPSAEGASVGETVGDEAAGAGGWVRGELLLAGEVAALTGFVVVRPVLESFGASPEAFVSRRAGGSDVWVFALLVTVVPLLALSVAGAVTGLLGSRVRQAVHLGTIGVLAALAVVQEVPIDARRVLVGMGVAVGVAVAVLRHRFAAARSFLRFASLGSLVFATQFVVTSPASSLVGGRDGGVDPAVQRVVQEAVGDDAPPVVMVVLDALPTASLLDGEGHIDAELYPNLARLAGDATWYRNHTTVAPVTLQALPAMLTGTVPSLETRAAVLQNYPRNLFTLLGGTYDLHVHEQVTALCPDGLCPEADDGALGPLLGDAEEIWRFTVRPPAFQQLLPGAFDDRFARTADWFDAQDFRQHEGGRPDLYFQHMMLPHGGWEYLPDGRRYLVEGPPTDSVVDTWGTFGQEVGAQRNALQTQAVDTLIGRMMDRLDEAGSYDDALIVVTADHGAAFQPGAHMRALDQANYEQIMWSPLIVKAPGQDDGAIDDRNVLNIDILPIVAGHLGIDLDEVASADGTPWDVDGAVPGDGPPRGASDKRILDMDNGDLEPNAPHHMVRVDGEAGFAEVLATDLIEGTGPEAVWQRTRYGDLVGADVGDQAGDQAGEIEVGEPSDVEMLVDDLDRWDDVDLDRPRIETRALGWIPDDSVVAVVLNGQVAAVAPARPTPYGLSVVHALLDPGALVGGDNDYALYLVDGPPGAPVLHRLPATATG